MAKVADKYFVINPWKIVEEGFDKEYSEVSESIYSLGNEYMGIRGYFEEGYSGNTLLGSYFNGVYESQDVSGSSYKGIIKKTEFMVNSVDWLYTRIIIDDEQLDLNECTIKDFRRELDLKTGILTRSFIWKTKEGKELELKFERLLSMNDAHLAGQRIFIKALNFSGNITLISGLDFTNIHHAAGKNLWNCKDIKAEEDWTSITGSTINTNQNVFSICAFDCKFEECEDLKEEKKVSKKFTVRLEESEQFIFTKVVNNIVNKQDDEVSFNKFNVKCNKAERNIKELNYDEIKENSIKWWEKVWNESDIIIDGDEMNQQGIRFCIFQMHQTYHGAEQGTVIGAKGLTGEAYSGNSFWDTEAYCLPFYIFNNLEAAKQLLKFRLMTLKEAEERAKDLDCEGAFFPIATISGRECCSLWQHASLQLQASTAVAYGIWHYENVTHDEEFTFNVGVPLLVEISRMLSTRGDWSADKTRYGYYGVMGPDEFQMMVNNNCYTNYMGKTTLEYTLDVLNRLKDKNNELYTKQIENLNVKQNELDNWKNISENMYIPYDEDIKIFEQHEGYFNLPYIDVDKIPVEDFPLYNHWTYDRIYRNSMIKQPDVLMFMLLYNSSFTEEQIKNNYEYYEPRCIHESSLSPSVHSILASQLKKHEEAYDFFGFATRMDLDNYNRNTREGLHTTSIAAAWMNILYGFGGMRSDKDILSFNPSIPAKWDGYSFRLCYKDDVIVVEINKENAKFYTLKGKKIEVEIYGQLMTLSGEKLSVNIPNEWRG
ncbi:glycoside hydrolase family 65 protein [Clostridium butyricum]